MEHKFGEFETIEELNRAAAAQKEEGDLEAVKAIAAENGIDEDDVEDYLAGAMDRLVLTTFIGAMAKLNLEEKELNLQSQLKDWKEYIVAMCSEDDDLCRAVFRPEKHLEDVLAAGLKNASKNRVQVDKRILKAAGLPDGAAYIGMCGRDELRKIVMDYYLGEKK